LLDVYRAGRITSLVQLSAELTSLPTGVNTRAQANTVSFFKDNEGTPRFVSVGEYLAVTKALRRLTSSPEKVTLQETLKGLEQK